MPLFTLFTRCEAKSISLRSAGSPSLLRASALSAGAKRRVSMGLGMAQVSCPSRSRLWRASFSSQWLHATKVMRLPASMRSLRRQVALARSWLLSPGR